MESVVARLLLLLVVADPPQEKVAAAPADLIITIHEFINLPLEPIVIHLTTESIAPPIFDFKFQKFLHGGRRYCDRCLAAQLVGFAMALIGQVVTDPEIRPGTPCTC